MRLEKRRWRDVVFVAVIGEFDSRNVSGITARIDATIDAGCIALVLDCGRLTFVNSAALGYVIHARKRIQEKGGNLVILRPGSSVRRTLTILGLEEILQIVETDIEAARVFHPEARDADLGLEDLPAETDVEPSTKGVVQFRLLDDAWPEEAEPAVGRIVSLEPDELTFRWRIPAPGEARVGDTHLTTESFDDRFREGTRVEVRVKLPHAVHASFLTLQGRVAEVEKAVDGQGVARAAIRLAFETLGAGDLPSGQTARHRPPRASRPPR